jgi:hypothetical protein
MVLIVHSGFRVVQTRGTGVLKHIVYSEMVPTAELTQKRQIHHWEWHQDKVCFAFAENMPFVRYDTYPPDGRAFAGVWTMYSMGHV